MQKEKIHYTANWVINPTEPITLFLIGAGGTGSNMLSCLAIINKSLIALGHPGLHVTVFDDDIVTEANIARQLFYTSDLRLHKAGVLVERINRAFGTNWQYNLVRYGTLFAKESIEGPHTANIILSCVDSVVSRKSIHDAIDIKTKFRNRDDGHPFYWVDCGNDTDFGQVFLGTTQAIKQPTSKFETVDQLESPWQQFKNKKDSKSTTPSCSLAAALTKQDLFINRMIANYAGHMLWTLIKEAKISYKGIYINLKNLQTNPIPL